MVHHPDQESGGEAGQEERQTETLRGAQQGAGGAVCPAEGGQGGCGGVPEEDTPAENRYNPCKSKFVCCTACPNTQELTDRLEGMKVAHLAEREGYEGQLTELRGEYSKTKEELEGEIMVPFGWVIDLSFAQRCSPKSWIRWKSSDNKRSN